MSDSPGKVRDSGVCFRASEAFSLYLHIPFCRRLCPFCHFYKVPEVSDDWRVFFLAVKGETGDRSGSIRTLYVGGGTPTLLSPGFYEAFFTHLGERFDLSGLGEATIETDGEVTAGDLEALAAAGFNRISIGVKSFVGRTRRKLGLGPLPDCGAALARAAGFASVSLDILYGVHGQSPRDFEEDLYLALEHQPDHVSLYCLEEKEASGPREGDPDTVAAMFRHGRRAMAAAGLSQYEITNFSRPGHESRHNMTYWEDGDYLGVGPSAHSSMTLDGVRIRWRNREDLENYMMDPAHCREGLSREEGRERAREALILGLRMTGGVSRIPFAGKYGFDPLDLLKNHLGFLGKAGLVKFDARRVRLTTRGMLLSNEVFVRVLQDREG